MSVVALHVSDLHRSTAEPLGNAELLAALVSDQKRWPGDLARNPQLVIVSGDVVQGVALGTADPESELDKQYADAADFLGKLTEHFLGGDRSRLVLVPGNHDVDWNTAQKAMTAVSADELGHLGGQLPRLILDPSSPYRWSWPERQLYKVVDLDAYTARFRRFLDFRRAFYEGVTPGPLLQEDLFFMEYPELDLTVTGLSSWFGNDCYCHVGSFDKDLLAAAQEAIARSACRLHVAVWHHSIAGAPAQSDFLDVELIHRLIDYGYRVGLHGHHHRTDASTMILKLPSNEEMALVSAGSLAAGQRELPVGVHRQYSVLEIHPSEHRVRVHVREAISALVFAASARAELGGKDHIDVGWSPAPTLRPPATQAPLDDAYAAFAGQDAIAAWEILRTLPPDGAARALRVEVARHLEKWQELTQMLKPPLTQEELTLLVEALTKQGLAGHARAALQAHGEAVGLSPDLRHGLEARIAMTEAGQ